jgi:hypothetical protein
MGRKHGATAAAKAAKDLRRTKGAKRKRRKKGVAPKVTTARVQNRIGTRLTQVPQHVLPGSKVVSRSRGSGYVIDNADTMIKRLKRLSRKSNARRHRGTNAKLR